MNHRGVRISGLSHSFGSTEVLHDITLEVRPDEFVALVGPSGCGKTTLLKLVAGHQPAPAGTIHRPGQARMVHQRDGLFPWLTVRENIRLGLRDIDERLRGRQLEELIEWIGMPEFAAHYPHQLSGGMRQRVELARAMAGAADLLLLDEPFSALDYLTRLRLRSELASMLAERPRTVLFVTHDIEEAAQLADRVCVLSERPARIRYEIPIDVPRPRGVSHPAVLDVVRRVLDDMGIEVNGKCAARQAPREV